MISLSEKPEKRLILTEDISFRLSFLKLISIVAVVYLHMYTSSIRNRGNDIELSIFYFTFVVEKCIHNITAFAVPLFFCISGFLFFVKDYNAGYKNFLWKKTKGVLFPYLLWNTICIFYLFLLEHLPVLGEFFVKAFPEISSWGLTDWIHAFIGFEKGWFPVLYPLWFLQTLYLVFVLIYH